MKPYSNVLATPLRYIHFRVQSGSSTSHHPTSRFVMRPPSNSSAYRWHIRGGLRHRSVSPRRKAGSWSRKVLALVSLPYPSINGFYMCSGSGLRTRSYFSKRLCVAAEESAAQFGSYRSREGRALGMVFPDPDVFLGFCCRHCSSQEESKEEVEEVL